VHLHTTGDLLAGATGDLARVGVVPLIFDGVAFRNLITLHTSGAVTTAVAGDMARDGGIPSWYDGAAWVTIGGNIDEVQTVDSNEVGLGVILGAQTAACQGIRHTATWNNVADTFHGLFVNITDTTSAAASKVVDIQVVGNAGQA